MFWDLIYSVELTCLVFAPDLIRPHANLDVVVACLGARGLQLAILQRLPGQEELNVLQTQYSLISCNGVQYNLIHQYRTISYNIVLQHDIA